jgi:SAM-dependent methyltransferase
MTASNLASLAAWTACPRCGKPLDAAHGLRCAACRVDFPDIDGIPWLFAEPNAALAEWRARLHRALRETEAAIGAAQGALRDQTLSALTRERLQRVAAARSQQMGELARLLTPLGLGEQTAALETHLALRTRLPPAQGLTTYYANLHRDWCWGDAENDASQRLVSAALGEAPAEALAVLGAGGGRLAYDLHMAGRSATTIALDFNPLLSLAHARIARGEALPLHEFPLAPLTLADTAIARTLKAPAPVSAGYHVVLGDVLRAPFRGDAFDAIVTPWLVDVIDESLWVFGQRINRLLKPGGRWVVFGSLAFVDRDPRACLSPEEAAAAIEACGFEIVAKAESTIPYMSSPASRHGRQEHVVALSATKRKRVAAPPRHSALPNWLVRSDQPVPLLDGFRTQATTTRIYAFLMGLIDGQRSIDAMAALMAQQGLMTAAEAAPAIRGFLIRMYDEAKSPAAL